MATLTLTIGTLTSSRMVNDVKARDVLEAVFDLRHPTANDDGELATYTNQEKLDWIVQVLIPQMLTRMSKQQAERLAMQAAADAFNADGAKFE